MCVSIINLKGIFHSISGPENFPVTKILIEFFEGMRARDGVTLPSENEVVGEEEEAVVVVVVLEDHITRIQSAVD